MHAQAPRFGDVPQHRGRLHRRLDDLRTDQRPGAGPGQSQSHADDSVAERVRDQFRASDRREAKLALEHAPGDRGQAGDREHQRHAAQDRCEPGNSQQRLDTRRQHEDGDRGADAEQHGRRARRLHVGSVHGGALDERGTDPEAGEDEGEPDGDPCTRHDAELLRGEQSRQHREHGDLEHGARAVAGGHPENAAEDAAPETRVHVPLRGGSTRARRRGGWADRMDEHVPRQRRNGRRFRDREEIRALVRPACPAAPNLKQGRTSVMRARRLHTRLGFRTPRSYGRGSPQRWMQASLARSADGAGTGHGRHGIHRFASGAHARRRRRPRARAGP